LSGIYYQEKGKGFPVLLLHGFCETHEIWKQVIDPLAAEFRVIAIDLPGFGKSAPLTPPHSIDDAADAVLRLITDDLHLEECVVLGHSLGGYVVLAMVEKMPGLFRAFGLVHSTAYADTEERKVSRNKVIEFVHQHGVETFVRSFIPALFYNQNNPHIGWTVALASGTPLQTLISYTAAMRDRPDRTQTLTDFVEPVLLLAGQEDTVIPVATMHEQAQLVKSPSLSLLNGVGHMGMLENEKDTGNAILVFLRKVI
jgi:pimeloyl-ACP methyl ester carboxylesterase